MGNRERHWPAATPAATHRPRAVQGHSPPRTMTPFAEVGIDLLGHLFAILCRVTS